MPSQFPRPELFEKGGYAHNLDAADTSRPRCLTDENSPPEGSLRRATSRSMSDCLGPKRKIDLERIRISCRRRMSISFFHKRGPRKTNRFFRGHQNNITIASTRLNSMKPFPRNATFLYSASRFKRILIRPHIGVPLSAFQLR